MLIRNFFITLKSYFYFIGTAILYRNKQDFPYIKLCIKKLFSKNTRITTPNIIVYPIVGLLFHIILLLLLLVVIKHMK